MISYQRSIAELFISWYYIILRSVHYATNHFRYTNKAHHIISSCYGAKILTRVEFGNESFRYGSLVFFRQTLQIIGVVDQSEVAKIALEK